MKMKKLLLIVVVIFTISSCRTRQNVFEKSWTNVNDRVWAGSEFWSNRLQDWRVQNGRLECVAENPRLMMRTTHLINCRLDDTDSDFFAEMNFGKLQSEQNVDASCGFLIGAGADLDVWGASLVQQNTGPGAGLFAGIIPGDQIFLKDMETGSVLDSEMIDEDQNDKLYVEVISKDSNGYIITIGCGKTQLSVDNIDKQRFEGNIALVSDPGKGDKPGTFWFNDLKAGGSKLEYFDHSAGPVISSKYTLNENILYMTAQMAPMGDEDTKDVFLEILNGDNWTQVAAAKMITPGYTANFRVNDWNSEKDTEYRIRYTYRSSENDDETAYWNGVIRHDPVEKDEIVIAGFTGNHNIAHPGLSRPEGNFNFNEGGIWYPHTDIVDNVKYHDPDLLFFSGDQVYEGNSPTFADRDHYELDYLYKWYLFCLAYRDLMKDRPTVAIPDDHDVYQGNLWGQGGRAIDTDNKGGYVHPAWFIKMLERTQTDNLPEPYDPAPIDQGIEVYYTSFSYGGIGFAVLEDRKFKSGCADNPFMTRGRPDHVIDPDYDVTKIDLPGKKLLGDRQLDFLDDWVTDWKGHEMKIALSQTIFANMATHHGGGLFRLIADLDSDGWPQTGRNKAIDALRKGFAVHLAGDQHLASIVHHGIDTWDDGIYSFCVPSVANFYPRAWWPESIGKDRPEGAPQNMGKHRDGFGNYVTVYGVTNPTGFTKVSTNQEPLELHDKMPGYGIVRMNKEKRTIIMECWPRYADASKDEHQYEGWPKTISQMDNYSREAYGYLPEVHVDGVENAVVEIRNEKTGELVYCLRIKGNEFKPKIFEQGSYRIIVRDPEKDKEEVFEGIKPAKDDKEKIEVSW